MPVARASPTHPGACHLPCRTAGYGRQLRAGADRSRVGPAVVGVCDLAPGDGWPPSLAADRTAQAKSAVEVAQVVAAAQTCPATHRQPVGRDLPNTLQASPVGLHHREDLERDASPEGSIRHHLLIEQPETLHNDVSAQFRKIESSSSGLPIRALTRHHALKEIEESLASCRCNIVRERRQSNGRHRRSRLPQDCRGPDMLSRLTWLGSCRAPCPQAAADPGPGALLSHRVAMPQRSAALLESAFHLTQALLERPDEDPLLLEAIASLSSPTISPPPAPHRRHHRPRCARRRSRRSAVQL